MKFKMLFIALFLCAFPALGKNSMTVVEVINTEDSNFCYDRFRRHSYQAAEAVNRYRLCSREYFYNSSSYREVTWDDYFTCVDKVGPHLSGKINFYSKCAQQSYNQFSLSQSPKDCKSKLSGPASKMSAYICFLEDHAERVLDSNYDNCVEEAKDLGQDIHRPLNLCSKIHWKEKLGCSKKLRLILGPEKAHDKCEKQTHRNAVSKNGFEGCMQDMSALELNKDMSFDVCVSEEPTETLNCVNENKTGLPAPDQARRCLGKDYRESNESRHFPTCAENARQDGLSKDEAINVCTKDKDTTELIAKDKEFRECSNSAIEEVRIKRTKAYAACKNPDVRKRILEPKFNNCLKKGLASGIFGHFNLSRDAVKELSDSCLEGPPSFSIENDYGVKLFADYNIHPQTRFSLDNRRLGGLSALRFFDDKLYILSDDKDNNGRARAYVYNYKVHQNGLQLEENDVISLKLKSGSQLSPEGLDILPNGSFIISGQAQDAKTASPLSIYSPTGNKIADIPSPGPYAINKGAESLSLSPSRSSLFIADEGELTRIVQYSLENGKFKEKAQYFYDLENEPANGISEVLAISETELLVLERSWDSRNKKITARIFYINLEGPPQGQSLSKRLIIDLDDIIPSLSPSFRSLENFEGMALGPKLPNGKESLVLVSDNNFKKDQRTLLVILEVDLEALTQKSK